MRFFLTGIGGFIGRRLARYLLARGDSVAGSYWGAAPELPADLAAVELAAVDVLDREALARAFRRAAPEAVIHLAGLSHVGESWAHPAEYFRVNVLGTENVLAAASGCPVLLASSAEVYGLVPAERQPISEDEPVGPRTPYALTKAAAERIAVLGGAVVARCFNLVGPGQSERFALPAFAAQLLAIERGEQAPLLKVGNLEARRDFIHVDDGVAALRLLAERGAAGEIYNVASGRSYSIAEALSRLLAISGVEAQVEVDPARVRPNDIPLLEGDGRRLAALGWKAVRTLDDALADLWAARAPADGERRG